MAREKPPDPPGDDVPAWIMTYSDVITLLMTFFILLLTFATDEPESFERMQVTLFGAGGGSGIAGESLGSTDLDAVLMRKRSRSGRITVRGSEIPPTFTDPVYESLAKGISGLEEHEDRTVSTTHNLTVPTSLLVNSDGVLTPFGAQQMRMIAIQMKKRPLHLDLFVADIAQVTTAYTLAEHLMMQEGIPVGRVGIGLLPGPNSEGAVRLIVTQQKDTYYGAQAKAGRTGS